MTRALGDAPFKPVVESRPDVGSLVLQVRHTCNSLALLHHIHQPDDLCVIAATDGLATPVQRVWQVATDALHASPPSQSTAQSIADALVAEALESSSDNVTVAVLLLNPPP